MTKPAGVTTCVDCQFYVNSALHTGFCHRRPPVIDINDKTNTLAVYPPVIDNLDWCGEWARHP